MIDLSILLSVAAFKCLARVLGGRVEVVLGAAPELVGRLVEWVVSRGGRVADLSVRKAGLREAFLARTGEALSE